MKYSCPYHSEALVDAKSGLRISKDCETAKMKPEVRTYLNLSADVNYWAREMVPALELAPAFHPKCVEKPYARGSLQILTPEPTTYLLHSGVAMGPKHDLMQLPVKVKTNTLSNLWHCYLNGKAINFKTELEYPLLKLPVGDFSLMCVDQQGHSDQVAFSIDR